MGAAGQDSGCNSVKTEQQEEKTMEINIFNTNKKYDVIYADPPWRYNDRKCNGACEHHYDTMTLEEIKKLPIKELCEKDCVLFLWIQV